jgi:hypothetical protein
MENVSAAGAETTPLLPSVDSRATARTGRLELLYLQLNTRLYDSVSSSLLDVDWWPLWGTGEASGRMSSRITPRKSRPQTSVATGAGDVSGSPPQSMRVRLA